MEEEIEVLTLDEEEKDSTNKTKNEDSINRNSIIVAPKRNKSKKTKEKSEIKNKRENIIIVPKRLLNNNSSNVSESNDLYEFDFQAKKLVGENRTKVLVVPPRIMHPLVYKERSEELIKKNTKEKETKQKKKVKVWLAILMFIILVIMFGSFYFLPKIDKYINIKYLNGTDEKKVEDTVKDNGDENVKANEEKTTTTKKPFNENLARTFSCNKNGVQLTDNINYSSSVIVYYIGIKAKKLKITTTEMFAVKNDTYNQLVDSCTTTIPAYNNKDGYNATCTVNDNTITINTEYDLTIFSTIKESDITIKAPFSLDTKIAKVKAIYTTTGYICD